MAQRPEAFSVPRRFANYAMVVADLGAGDAAALEDAIGSPRPLQGGVA